MGSVTILCPRTGRRVATGVEMRRYEFEAMPVVQATMHCWACGGEHNWSKRWATFVEEHEAAPAARIPVPHLRRGREQFRSR